MPDVQVARHAPVKGESNLLHELPIVRISSVPFPFLTQPQDGLSIGWSSRKGTRLTLRILLRFFIRSVGRSHQVGFPGPGRKESQEGRMSPVDRSMTFHVEIELLALALE